MKKEKINLTQEEKMIKRFKEYSNIIQLLEGIIIAVLVMAVIISIITLFESNFNFYEVKKELLSGFEYNDLEFKSNFYFLQTNKSLNETLFLIATFGKFIVYLLILECIGRIMIDTYKNETPFLKQNIRRIKFLAIYTLLFNSLMCFIIMLAIHELFKYGYKLQKESDETL